MYKIQTTTIDGRKYISIDDLILNLQEEADESADDIRADAFDEVANSLKRIRNSKRR